jgi:hypothetical protein
MEREAGHSTEKNIKIYISILGGCRVPPLPALGAVAHNISALEDTNNNAGLQLRMDAMKERERLEDCGIGDELMEMQQVIWPVEQLRVKDFPIDMLFEYKDDDGSTLMWCQGKVVDFIRELEDKHVFVMIEWSEKYVRDGDPKATKKQLKTTNCNPNAPVGGAW